MDWVESDKHLSVLEVLKEFSERFEQLNVRDRNIIMSDKVINTFALTSGRSRALDVVWQLNMVILSLQFLAKAFKGAPLLIEELKYD